MTLRQLFQRVVLIGVLVLPATLYIVFVYGNKEVFFQTLDYVGPKRVVSTEAGWDTAYYEVPQFALVDQEGRAFSREALDSSITVMSFFFATCPTICPAMNFHLNGIERRFKGVKDVQLVSITVDPEKDSVEALANYAAVRGYNTNKWHFLTGEKDSIYQLAKQVYLNAFEDQTAPGGFLHSTSVVLIDWNGNIRSRTAEDGNLVGAYDVLEAVQLNDLEEDVKILIAEYERAKHNANEK